MFARVLVVEVLVDEETLRVGTFAEDKVVVATRAFVRGTTFLVLELFVLVLVSTFICAFD